MPVQNKFVSLQQKTQRENTMPTITQNNKKTVVYARQNNLSKIATTNNLPANYRLFGEFKEEFFRKLKKKYKKL